LNEKQIKVKNPSGPCIEEHEVGLLPGIIKMEGGKIFLNLRGRKLSSSRLAVTLTKVGVDGSGIPSTRMDTDDDIVILSKALLFKNTEHKMLLLLE
jgi:hypothetical protein